MFDFTCAFTSLAVYKAFAGSSITLSHIGDKVADVTTRPSNPTSCVFSILRLSIFDLCFQRTYPYTTTRSPFRKLALSSLGQRGWYRHICFASRISLSASKYMEKKEYSRVCGPDLFPMLLMVFRSVCTATWIQPTNRPRRDQRGCRQLTSGVGTVRVRFTLFQISDWYEDPFICHRRLPCIQGHHETCSQQVCVSGLTVLKESLKAMRTHVLRIPQ